MRRQLFLIIFLFCSVMLFAVRIEGKIKSHGVQIGNVRLVFIDAENHDYRVKSNFLGEYQLELPPGYYRVSIDEGNYTLADFHQKTYSILKPEIINFQVEKKEKEIEGMILEEDGYPVEGAEITVKTSQGFQKIKSDVYGKFAAKVSEDLVTVYVEKEGFVSGGEVMLLTSEQSVRNIQIVLKKQYSYIRGIVTDGVKALPGVMVRLRDENLNILDETFSDSLGYYEFSKVENNRRVAVGVHEESFQEYLSYFFFIDKNYEKEHIILRKM